jgi:hypothetical protein
LSKINDRGTEFIEYYFELLHGTEFSEKEELTIIDFAMNTINADEIVEYSEVKFFKAIRKCLNLSDETILAVYPDLEIYLEDDIDTESELDKLVNSYLKTVVLPQFAQINFEDIKNE